jgi:5'-3' exonuclease
MSNPSPLVIVDSNSLIVRYGYVSEENIIGRVMKKIFFILRKFNTKKVVFLMDKCKKNYRFKVDSNYKKNRKPLPEAIFRATEEFPEYLEKKAIPVDFHEEYEADDLCASYANYYHGKFSGIIIVTTDKDMLQVVDDEKNIGVFYPFKSSIPTNSYGLVREAQVFEKFGVHPRNFNLYLALVGDNADNIPGIEGIGPVNAKKLIKEGLRQDRLMEEDRWNFESLDKMLKLTTCNRNCPLRHEDLAPTELAQEEDVDW